LSYQEVGETYLETPSTAIGRVIKVNLKEITGNVKDQNSYVLLQVNKATGTQLNTVLVGYEVTPSGIKRAVRQNTCRVDDFFKTKTKGGKEVVVKTLMVTVNKTQRSKCSMLRKILKDALEEEISKMDFGSFITNVATQKFQSITRKKLSKVYPVRDLTIKVAKLTEKGLIQEEAVVHDVSAEKEQKETKAEASEAKEE
jgi:ribosomal protein S3AE